MSHIDHGGLDLAELERLGLRPESVLDFSSNINPFGPPEGVVAAVRAAVDAFHLASYPDRGCGALRRRLAEVHRVDPGRILVGNGSADLIHLAMQVVAPGRRVAVLGPTFGEYVPAVRRAGGRPLVVAWPGWAGSPQEGFHPADTSLDQVRAALVAAQPEWVVLCNPNNPTGDLLTPEAFAHLRRALPHTHWLLDLAYAPFTEVPVSAPLDSRTVVLHSLTKDFALAGLRLGYLVGPQALVDRLRSAQPPWNVNGLAQVAGLAALEHLDWRTRTLARLREECARLRGDLARMGWRPRDTATHFFLLPVDDPGTLRSRLLRRGLLVRDASSFGLSGFVRIAARKAEDNARLLAGLAQERPQAPHRLAPSVEHLPEP